MLYVGMNTGFGGSANTRTNASDNLKADLLRGLQYGTTLETQCPAEQCRYRLKSNSSRAVLPVDHQIKSCMPESWVRASILVRLNSLAKGTSGIRFTTISTLLSLLDKNITPLIPLRGSISASGDLSPLSYIAGVLEGKPSLSAYVGPHSHSQEQRRLVRADVALAENQVPALDLGPREALALVNGTAVSAAVAAFASHEALLLASLAHILTAMSVEALRGTDEPFHPFFAQVRPHRGQAESAAVIFSSLAGSSLIWRNHSFAEASLRQDRYSIRTAAQWIGPCVEDILLAHDQITVELNSATDNPLIDASSAVDKEPRILHGGNFQAKSITSAVEKIRQAAQSIGRMMFTQCTELINPATSCGLPPNLVVDEPSENFIFKGTDVLIAALLSELGFLANAVGSHVQTAEMGNQALNSLALISARYTLESLDILAQLAAAHLLALCQALDLRALNARFIERLRDVYEREFKGIEALLLETKEREAVKDQCWNALIHRLDTTTSLDSKIRIPGAVSSLQPLLLGAIPKSVEALSVLERFTKNLAQQGLRLHIENKVEYLDSGSAEKLLGRGTRPLYEYVRKDLHIPIVGSQTLSTPTSIPRGNNTQVEDRGITMGALNGRVRASMAEGGLYGVVVKCFRDFGVEGEEGRKTTATSDLWNRRGMEKAKL